ncbi:AraC family transcriptional regulator [Enterovirga rhinocerotis]|uniref:AraC family transcriptional regulator n=1 Tax=Enterovirga rhinocerotis TaxID=1339210 RepID=UPI001FDF5B78|nr:helix-turn-helix transcriptional regulator [Enterovirga rhinocerotis]
MPRPVAAMAACYPASTTSTRHAHRRGQFVLQIAAVTSMTTDHGGFVIPPGHGFWIPPGIVHQSRSWGDAEIQTLYIDQDSVPDYPRKCRLIRASPLLQALMDEVTCMPLLYDEEARDGRIVDLLLGEIGRMPEVSLHVPIPADPRLARVCEAVLADTSSCMTLDDWAAHGGMSRRTFTRLFRRETGQSFSAWRQRVRLLEALARLGTGEPVTSVALDIGYDSPSAFTAMFRRELGDAPKRYLRWSDPSVVVR